MTPLATQLSWSHFIELFPLKTEEASLTLFVAASKADEMETVKNLLVSVLNRSIE